MTEKRFTETHLLECQMIFDAKTERGYYFNGEQVDIDDIKYLVDLLNNLNEELLSQTNLCNFYRERYMKLLDYIFYKIRGEVND